MVLIKSMNYSGNSDIDEDTSNRLQQQIINLDIPSLD